MARHIYVDRAEKGGFTVRILTRVRADKTHKFTDRDEARRFATSKLGRQGFVMDTTDRTPEQLAAHKDRERKLVDQAAAVCGTVNAVKGEDQNALPHHGRTAARVRRCAPARLGPASPLPRPGQGTGSGRGDQRVHGEDETP